MLIHEKRKWQADKIKRKKAHGRPMTTLRTYVLIAHQVRCAAPPYARQYLHESGADLLVVEEFLKLS
jgi:hypothetical protein